MFSALVNFYNSIPTSVWALLWSAVVVSGVVEVVKHLVVKDVASLSNKTQITLATALSFLASGAQQLFSTAAVSPTVLGSHTLLLVAATHLLYNFVLQPAVSLVKDAKAYRAQTTPSAPAAGGATQG